MPNFIQGANLWARWGCENGWRSRHRFSDALKPMQRPNAEIRPCRGFDQRSSTDGLRPYLGKVVSGLSKRTPRKVGHTARNSRQRLIHLFGILRARCLPCTCAMFTVRRTNCKHLKFVKRVCELLDTAPSERVRSVRVAPSSLFKVPVYCTL